MGLLGMVQVRRCANSWLLRGVVRRDAAHDGRSLRPSLRERSFLASCPRRQISGRKILVD